MSIWFLITLTLLSITIDSCVIDTLDPPFELAPRHGFLVPYEETRFLYFSIVADPRDNTPFNEEILGFNLHLFDTVTDEFTFIYNFGVGHTLVPNPNLENNDPDHFYFQISSDLIRMSRTDFELEYLTNDFDTIFFFNDELYAGYMDANQLIAFGVIDYTDDTIESNIVPDGCFAINPRIIGNKMFLMCHEEGTTAWSPGKLYHLKDNTFQHVNTSTLFNYTYTQSRPNIVDAGDDSFYFIGTDQIVHKYDFNLDTETKMDFMAVSIIPMSFVGAEIDFVYVYDTQLIRLSTGVVLFPEFYDTTLEYYTFNGYNFFSGSCGGTFFHVLCSTDGEPESSIAIDQHHTYQRDFFVYKDTLYFTSTVNDTSTRREMYYLNGSNINLVSPNFRYFIPSGTPQVLNFEVNSKLYFHSQNILSRTWSLNTFEDVDCPSNIAVFCPNELCVYEQHPVDDHVTYSGHLFLSAVDADLSNTLILGSLFSLNNSTITIGNALAVNGDYYIVGNTTIRTKPESILIVGCVVQMNNSTLTVEVSIDNNADSYSLMSYQCEEPKDLNLDISLHNQDSCYNSTVSETKYDTDTSLLMVFATHDYICRDFDVTTALIVGGIVLGVLIVVVILAVIIVKKGR